ncbi:MAG: hypothetical protein AAF696_21550 [Bacteroidota bacterium]
MKKIVINSILAFICFVLISGSFVQAQEGPALASIKKGQKGLMFTDINAKLIKSKISNGYFKLLKVDFILIDKKFYLMRFVESKGGKKGTLYSEVAEKGGKLYPIKTPKFYWPCWQTANCQCDRPKKYGDCSCTAGYGGCVQEWGWGSGANEPLEKIFDNIYW